MAGLRTTQWEGTQILAVCRHTCHIVCQLSVRVQSDIVYQARPSSLLFARAERGSSKGHVCNAIKFF